MSSLAVAYLLGVCQKVVCTSIISYVAKYARVKNIEPLPSFLYCIIVTLEQAAASLVNPKAEVYPQNFGWSSEQRSV